MKTYLNILYSIFILQVFLFACNDKESYEDQIRPDQSVRIAMKIPGIGSSTRAVEESLISNMTVLVFEDGGNGYQFSYRTPGYSLAYLGDSIYEFYAKLTYTELPVRLYLLANTPTVVNTILPGATELAVRDGLTGIFTSSGFDGALPMFGELDFPGGVTADEDFVSTSLVRSVARVDVVSTAADFELATIQVYRASDRYQIIPDAMTDFIVTVPSIPAGTTQSVNTEQLPVTNNQSLGQVYLPESPMPAEADRRLGATVVVVGGIYGNDTDTTYYRMDFVPDDNPDLFGQILRNHRYRFNITNVLSSGWETPDEAAESEPTQVEVDIVVWNETTTTMVFDEVRYFGVSTRTINFRPSAGLRDTIIVETNLEEYQLYWADVNGTIDEEAGSITPGESFADPDSIFIVSVSGDGTLISFLTNTSNRTGEVITRYLVAGADRLRLRLTVSQDPFRLQNRALKVYGTTLEIGSLGNTLLGGGTNTPGSRAISLANLLNNTDNFGPDGTVDIEGILRGGVASYEVTAANAELFDVLYFPYPGNPSDASVQVILNWLNAVDNRVLIVHFDNTTNTGNTNRRLLTALGFTTGDITGTIPGSAPYTGYANAPVEIMNGAFGEVPTSIQYRNYDDIHGEINLDVALAKGISPILIGNGGGVVLGVDFNRRIVYSGDVDIYGPNANGRAGVFLTNDGVVGDNQAAILMGNLWAWIATVALTE